MCECVSGAPEVGGGRGACPIIAWLDEDGGGGRGIEVLVPP